MSNDYKWLIWSREHSGWWKQYGDGYTPRLDSAGRYSLQEASDVCREANKFCCADGPPEETMVHESCFASMSISKHRKV